MFSDFSSSSDKVIIQGNLTPSISFRDLVKIVQGDIESAKKEWLMSVGNFANLLFSGIFYRQDNFDDDVPLYDNSKVRFYFDPQTAKYYYFASNRAVSKSALDKLLDNRLVLARQELAAYENALTSNRISLDTFQEASAKALKSLYIQNYALGNGGFANLSGVDLSEIESILNTEVSRIYRASEAIRGQQLSKSQLSTVLNNTVGAGNTIYHQGRKSAAREAGKPLAQRLLGNTINDRHCADCIAMVARGIQPIEQVPVPGEQCACSRKCKCSIVFYQRLEDVVKPG